MVSLQTALFWPLDCKRIEEKGKEREEEDKEKAEDTKEKEKDEEEREDRGNGCCQATVIVAFLRHEPLPSSPPPQKLIISSGISVSLTLSPSAVAAGT